MGMDLGLFSSFLFQNLPCMDSLSLPVSFLLDMLLFIFLTLVQLLKRLAPRLSAAARWSTAPGPLPLVCFSLQYRVLVAECCPYPALSGRRPKPRVLHRSTGAELW